MARYLYMSLVKEKNNASIKPKQNLINNLRNLKLELSNDKEANVEKFNNTFSNALDGPTTGNISASGSTQLTSMEKYADVPSWVDQNIGTIQNPRKPNSA